VGLPDETTQERIAENDHAFRAANDRIKEFAEDARMAERLPFICECADPGCTELVKLSLSEYEQVRSDPRRFVTAIGHETAAQGAARVVEQAGGHEVVEKLGHAAEVAEDLALEETAADG
jgi:hypothetical protein